MEESGLRLAGGWREREQTVGGRSALRRNAARFLDAFGYDERSTGLRHACAVHVCPLNICADNTASRCAGNNIGLNTAGGRRGCSGTTSGRRPNAQSRNQQSTSKC